MFSQVRRPDTINVVSLGIDEDGRLHSIQHQAVAATSQESRLRACMTR
jgi:xanthine dehydrogenase YagR molybdenum-binding subunit